MSNMINKVKNELMAEGYSGSELKMLLEEFAQIRQEFSGVIKEWLNGEVISDIQVEGYSLKKLQSDFGMSFIAAILILGWLRKDPTSARAAMAYGIK